MYLLTRIGLVHMYSDLCSVVSDKFPDVSSN